jgi:ABC-type uncharacterized transport system permease subunit
MAGSAPFLMFCLAFEIVSIIFLVKGSFLPKSTGQLTQQRYRALQILMYADSFFNSARLPAQKAAIGVVPGALIVKPLALGWLMGWSGSPASS